MPEIKKLCDVMRELEERKASGALFVAVKEKSESLVRYFFREGRIVHVSYGQSSGRDCLEIVDCYQFDTAYFVKDMKSPAASPDLPPTPQIIEQARKNGQSVAMK